MIVLTAQMRIQGENPLPFTLGVSELGGGALFGETIDEEVKFDRRNLLSLESEVKDRADIDKPSFGIISTGGSLSFKDTTSRFLNYANAGLLTEGIEIKIFLENTVKKTKKQVGQYYTTDWDYDNDSRSVDVSFKDDLEEWQNTTVSQYNFVDSQYMIDYLQEILNKYIPEKSLCKISESAKTRLNTTYCKYPYFDSDRSLWQYIEKICKICGLYAHKDGEGYLVFSSEF